MIGKTGRRLLGMLCSPIVAGCRQTTNAPADHGRLPGGNGAESGPPAAGRSIQGACPPGLPARKAPPCTAPMRAAREDEPQKLLYQATLSATHAPVHRRTTSDLTSHRRGAGPRRLRPGRCARRRHPADPRRRRRTATNALYSEPSPSSRVTIPAERHGQFVFTRGRHRPAQRRRLRQDLRRLRRGAPTSTK